MTSLERSSCEGLPIQDVYKETEKTESRISSSSEQNMHLPPARLPIEAYLEKKQSLQQLYQQWAEGRLRTLSNLDALGNVLGVEAPNRTISFRQGQAVITIVVPGCHRRAVPFDKGVICETLQALNEDWCQTNQLYEDMWVMLDPGDTICMNFGRGANRYTRVRFTTECGQEGGYKAYVLLHEDPHEPQTIGYLLSGLQSRFRPGESLEYDWDSFRLDARHLEHEYHIITVAYNLLVEEIDATILELRDEGVASYMQHSDTTSDSVEFVDSAGGRGSKECDITDEINDNKTTEMSQKQEPRDTDNEDSEDLYSPSKDPGDSPMPPLRLNKINNNMMPQQQDHKGTNNEDHDNPSNNSTGSSVRLRGPPGSGPSSGTAGPSNNKNPSGNIDTFCELGELESPPGESDTPSDQSPSSGSSGWMGTFLGTGLGLLGALFGAMFGGTQVIGGVIPGVTALGAAGASLSLAGSSGSSLSSGNPGSPNNTNLSGTTDTSVVRGRLGDPPGGGQGSDTPPGRAPSSGSSGWKRAFLGTAGGLTTLATAGVIVGTQKYKQYKGWWLKMCQPAKRLLYCFLFALVAVFCWGGLSNHLRSLPFWLNSVLVATVLCLAATLGIYRYHLSAKCPEMLLLFWNEMVKQKDQFTDDIQTVCDVSEEVQDEIQFFKRV